MDAVGNLLGNLVGEAVEIDGDTVGNLLGAFVVVDGDIVGELLSDSAVGNPL